MALFPSCAQLSHTDSEVVAFNLAIDSLSARSEHKNCFFSYDSQTTAIERVRVFVYACTCYSERQRERRDELSINITGHKLQKDGSHCFNILWVRRGDKAKNV